MTIMRTGAFWKPHLERAKSYSGGATKGWIVYKRKNNESAAEARVVHTTGPTFGAAEPP